MEDNKDKKDKKLRKRSIILMITSTILLLGLVSYFLSYLYFSRPQYTEYENSVKAYEKQIVSINDSLTNISTIAPIDYDVAKEDIPKTIKELKNLKSSIPSTGYIAKYADAHEALLNGLSSNISFLEQMNLILNNQESNELDIAKDNLINYKASMLENYESANFRSTSFSLSDRALSSFDSMIAATDEIIAKNIAASKIKSDCINFFISFDRQIINFSNLKANYMINLNSVRSGKSSYDELILSMENNKKDIDNILLELDSLSPQERLSPTLKTFRSIVYQYKTYTYDFIYSLKEEKTSTKRKDLKTMNKLYEDPNSLYKNVTNSYKDFLKDYEVIKSVLTR
ncbi:hypothetical protein [Clostridium cellulovorans]|uniref:DUF3829 domain-containing protein n=1 Tax=Clostridium cellulovorans (strain ATCC 35296 / DSM 3052 / OCM 3 / 743B) TaxID=573061 RepID=D9SX46_CLOC7|nr:hypothetical protein [Clostridium cellulovorans]ADL53349.1 hypothetical protein Clocel_3679 [Clostridium cellulovorans 743B]